MAENKKSDKKILLLGLDNSGKTSILLSLKETTNLLSFFSLKPTKRINIESFQNQEPNIVIWDFGGQEQYRKEYLTKFDRYIIGTSKIIYVIDIQDIDRYGASLKYLTSVINFIKEKEKLDVDFSIFLHKYDPTLIYQDNFKEINEKIDSELIPKINKIIPPELDFKIYETSIYTIFKKQLR